MLGVLAPGAAWLVVPGWPAAGAPVVDVASVVVERHVTVT
jgi:hypothetical protein